MRPVTMILPLQQICGIMTSEAAEMQYNMGIADKFRGGYGRQTIAAAEIWGKGKSDTDIQ